MALAGVVLLLGGYVSSYFAAEWLVGEGMIPSGPPLRRLYVPLTLYEESDLPGSVEFFAVALWFNSAGRASLANCRDSAISNRSRTMEGS